MQRASGIYRDSFGRPVSGATVTVYNAGTQTLATIYQASGSISSPAGQTNPFSTASDGSWSFAVANGAYDFNIQSISTATEYHWNVFLADIGGPFLANPMTAQGDTIGGGLAGAVTRVPANTTATAMYLYGANSAVPQFKQVAATEISGLAAFIVANGVSSFNGRIGTVAPQFGDYPASLVPFTQAGAGVVNTTVDASLKAKAYNAVTDFGCDNTGATNCTTQLLAFFNACINNEHSGYIPAGTYKVTTGVLVFDTPFVDAAWPMIYTDGYQATILSVDSATATNAPVLKWTNGTANSAAGRYWRGGYLGGLTINDATGATAASRHAISLRGVWGLHFDYIATNGIRGNVVEIEPLLYTGNNPDPYAVTFCLFEGVEGNSCAGAVFKNENYVGFNGCRIKILRAITTGGGIFYGCGAGNVIDFISASACNGWAIDDGGFVDHNGGSASRFTLKEAELDNVENGIRLNSLFTFSFQKIRFVHRYNTSPNVSAGYWPRTALSVAGGTSPSVIQGDMQFVHRIEAGGAKSDLGAFYSFNNNGNGSGLVIDYYPVDNAGLGLVDSDFYTNTSSAVFKLSNTGRITFNSIQNYTNTQILFGANPGLITQNSNLTYVVGAGLRVGDSGAAVSASTGALALANGGIGVGAASYFGAGVTFAGVPSFTNGTAAIVNNASYWYWKDSGGTSRRVLGMTGGNIFYIGAIDTSVSVATFINSGSTITFQVNGSSGTFINAGSMDAAGNFNPKFYTSAVVGGAVASASSITPTGPIFHVSGSTTINTISLPFTGFTGSITIIPDGRWSTGTSGNIANAITANVGQSIQATYDGTKWQLSFLSSASGSAVAAAPTGTTSTTFVMMGVNFTITPTKSGTLVISGSGQMANGTLNDGATVQLYYGTGTPPINGAAVTGTSIGTSQTHTSLVAADTGGWSFTVPVPALTVGTAYWVDVALKAVTGGTASITGVTVAAVEI